MLDRWIGAVYCYVKNLLAMNSKTVIRPVQSPPPLGPYSHAVRAGHFLFCSGQIPVNPGSGELVRGDIQAQTSQVLLNIQSILESEKLTFDNVVKSTVFMTDLREFGLMNKVYAEFFRGDPPARSTIQVAALPKGAEIEIEVIAAYPMG
jgi:2-iminobutanoate/2-iminopropanoate deaminase